MRPNVDCLIVAHEQSLEHIIEALEAQSVAREQVKVILLILRQVVKGGVCGLQLVLMWDFTWIY